METTTKAKVLVKRECGHDHLARTNLDKPYYKVGDARGYYCPECKTNTAVVSVEAR